MKKYINTSMKKYFVNYLLIATMLAIASCSSKEEPLAASEEVNTPATNGENYLLNTTQFQSGKMQLGKLEMNTFHEMVKATGMFDMPPENRVSVSSYFGGTVKDIRLLPGEAVKKGQTLFILENPDYVQLQQDYLEAKGQLTYLKSDYERQKNLMQDKVTSEKNYLKAESDYTVTKVKVESLGKKLRLMNINPNTLNMENMQTTIHIYSPINGYVTQVDINRGIFLNPSQTALTVVDADHLHLELTIFERDLPKVKVGQAIQFNIQSDDTKQYEASVHLVNKSVDMESRKVAIHGHLSDESLASIFNPGMYVEADIFTTSISKFSLPKEAVIELDGQYFVLLLTNTTNDGYQFMRKEVRTGLSDNEAIEILNAKDFKEDAQFLVRGAFNLITE